MTVRFLGIAIREQSLAAVVLARRRRALRVEAHARVPLTASGGEGDGLAGALQALAADIDPGGCACAVSIPPGMAAFRNLRVPFDHPRKIRQVLPFELEPALPLPLDELSIGFQVLDGGRGSGTTALLAAAVPGTRLQEVLGALSAAGIRPDTVTLGGYAAARWIARRPGAGDALYIDLDGNRCAAFALSGGEVKAARAFTAGGDRAGETLCSRVLQTLRAMEEMLPGAFAPQAAIVVGAGPGGSDLSAELQARLGIPARPVDWSRDVEVPATGWQPAGMDDSLALALAQSQGLAGIDFRPGPTGMGKAWSENRAPLLRTAGLAAALLLLALAGALLDAGLQKNRLEDLNRQAAALLTQTFPEVRTVVDPLQQMRVKVQEARRAASSAAGAGERVRALDLLREISLRIPAAVDVRIAQAMIDRDGVRMAGTTDGFDAVDRIKNSLAEIPGVASVGIASATVEKATGRVQFQLNMTL